MGKIYGYNGKIYIGKSTAVVNYGVEITSKAEWKIKNNKIIDKNSFGDKTYEVFIPFGDSTIFEGSLEFEDTYKNFFFPEIRKPYTKVPFGTYKPSDLGIKLIGVKQITVGNCMQGIERFPGAIAHAHPDTICVYDGHFVLAGRGKPESALLHEQAHVLAGLDALHGEDWVEIAKRLGVENPGPTINYKYSDSLQEQFGFTFAPHILSI